MWGLEFKCPKPLEIISDGHGSLTRTTAVGKKMLGSLNFSEHVVKWPGKTPGKSTLGSHTYTLSVHENYSKTKNTFWYSFKVSILKTSKGQWEIGNVTKWKKRTTSSQTCSIPSPIHTEVLICYENSSENKQNKQLGSFTSKRPHFLNYLLTQCLI